MTTMRRVQGLGLIGCGLLAAGMVVAQPAPTPAPAPAPKADAPAAVPADKLLSAIQPGTWRLRMIDGEAGAAPGDMCVADVRQLVQIRHGASACDRFVASDEAKEATVSYTCHGAGSGRTTLRLLNDGGVRIDSQGIADKAPFAFVAEARRTGDCAAAAAR
jgi:hypothetical protein